jgi:hippurate hydrolase
MIGLTAIANAEVVASDEAQLHALYLELHRNPELSFKETATAARMAEELTALGFTVTPGFGGTGVVALLENGSGPTVMVRADMDALPVAEQTGLPYASTRTGVSIDGEEQPVMHACGHDIHMTVLIGTAARLATQRDRWRGTLIMIAQPAEERGAGAKAMLDAGLFSRFPRPDFNLALHVSAGLPAGQVGYVSGAALANVDSVDITVRGIGGHGAYPHATRDPVVLAAQIPCRCPSSLGPSSATARRWAPSRSPPSSRR